MDNRRRSLRSPPLPPWRSNYGFGSTPASPQPARRSHTPGPRQPPQHHHHHHRDVGVPRQRYDLLNNHEERLELEPFILSGFIGLPIPLHSANFSLPLGSPSSIFSDDFHPLPPGGWGYGLSSAFAASPPGFGVPDARQQQEDVKLTEEERKTALRMLRKEIYNPMPRRLLRRLSLYYKDRNLNTHGRTEKDPGDDEEAQRCAVCLEDFEPRETTTVTPCNHMFHEECIVPWIVSHSECPVCRFVIKQPSLPSA